MSVRRLADHFLRREAQHAAGGGVDERDAPFSVHAEDAFGGGFEDEPRAFFADLQLFALGGQLLLLGEQFLLLRKQFLLRLGQFLGLLFELAGLFLGLRQQFLRAEVALKNLQAHRDHRQQLFEQRSARSSVNARKEANSIDAQQRVFRHQRPRDGLDRRGLSQAGGDAEIVRRKIGERDRLALARALADQALTQPERIRGLSQSSASP